MFDLSLEQVEQKVDNNQLTKQTNEVITISALGISGISSYRTVTAGARTSTLSRILHLVYRTTKPHSQSQPQFNPSWGLIGTKIGTNFTWLFVIVG